MPEPKLRYYLHSKVASTGHGPIYFPVGMGETCPVRQATGYTAHPAYFAPKATHMRKGADGYRTINEKLDELRLAVQKICRHLQDDGQFNNTALMPLLKAAVTSLAGKPVVERAPAVV
jgi:hypothetical protein